MGDGEVMGKSIVPCFLFRAYTDKKDQLEKVYSIDDRGQTDRMTTPTRPHALTTPHASPCKRTADNVTVTHHIIARINDPYLMPD